jgi:hypothetical protein
MVLLAAGAAAYLEGRLRDALNESSRAEAFFRSNCTGVYWELNTVQAFAMWSLVFLGETAELNRLCPKFMKEAQSRGDSYGYANLCSLAMPLLNMAADRAEEGHRELSEEMERWSKEGFHIQRPASLYMKTHMLLYLHKEGASEQAAREMQQALRESHATLVQTMRMASWDALGRAQVATARTAVNPAAYLKAAERSAARLDRQKRPDARSLATLIRAGIASCKGDLDKARESLELALSGLAACGLVLFASAARRHLGQLIGGDQGKALVAEVDRWMTSQGIRNPARMTAVYAPGFADP